MSQKQIEILASFVRSLQYVSALQIAQLAIKLEKENAQFDAFKFIASC
jgi:hypothetical protein